MAFCSRRIRKLADEREKEEEILDEIDGMEKKEARDYLESEGYDPEDFGEEECD